jgi:multiple sugar transport system permease protein
MAAVLSNNAAKPGAPGAHPPVRAGRRHRLEGHPLLPYALVLPATLYLLVFQGYPLLRELMLSFTSTSLLSPAQGEWVGLRNYADLWSDPDFHRVILTTLLYTLACVASAIGLGLASALLLDGPFRGRGIARAAVTIPWAAPPVAVALIFIWIYNAQYGVFGHTLRFFGIEAGNENWLDSMQHAMPAVLLTTIWQIFPFASVVLLAALQGVPSELREAAVMDGADRLSVFKAVVWPTIRPSVALLALFSTIWSLRRFDLIWLLTQGGPVGATNTLVIDLYRRAFVNHHLGQAAAVGMVGVAIALAVTLVYFRYTARAERQGAR